MTETGTKLSISFISQCNPDTKADRKDMSYMKILKKKICCIAVSVYEKSFHKALRLCLSFSAPGLDLTMDVNLIIIG